MTTDGHMRAFSRKSIQDDQGLLIETYSENRIWAWALETRSSRVCWLDPQGPAAWTPTGKYVKAVRGLVKPVPKPFRRLGLLMFTRTATASAKWAVH